MSLLLTALRDPTAYPHAVAKVETQTTHISWLFFAGDFVYKVKRPVDVGFADFTELEQRRFFCEEEVRLNRPLAPGVHLGVVPITRDEAGRIAVEGHGAVIEFAVKMVRLPKERMLDHLLEEGSIDNAFLDELARMLADFHRHAPTGPGVDEHGSPEAVRRNALENFEALEAQRRKSGASLELSPILESFLRECTNRFLDRNHELFARRVEEGRIRDGHGDLHSGNICLTPAGIRIYDRIEFAPRFRCGDVASDVAFAAMDLDLRCFRGFAAYLVRRYSERAEDPELERLVPFYKGYRALVRAKVAVLRGAGAESAGDEIKDARSEAFRYLHLASASAIPASLIMLCGLPATGKSYAARHLAGPSEATILRSDVIRKRDAGLFPTTHARDRFGEGIYARRTTKRVYRLLLEQARDLLQEGRTVILDASFGSRASRAPLLELAHSMSRPVVVVYLESPELTIRERLEARLQETGEVSDADLSIYLAARERFEPPDDVAPELRVHGDGVEAPEVLVTRTLEALVCQVPTGLSW